MGLPHRMDEMTAEARTLNATGAEMRRLWAEGIGGSAVITAVADTGGRLAGNVVVELGLLVTVDGQEPYATTLRMPIGGSDLSPYATGRRYAVKIDAQDRHKLTFAG
jgi:hypothetical protein